MINKWFFDKSIDRTFYFHFSGYVIKLYTSMVLKLGAKAHKCTLIF